LEASKDYRAEPSTTDQALETAVASVVHRAIKKVTFDLEQFGFNTAIAAMMEAVNELYRLKTGLALGSEVWSTNLRLLVQILAPFAPHLTEELWHDLGGSESVHVANWPTFDPELVRDELVTIVLQVNGKVRGKIEVPSDASKDDIKTAAHANENIARNLESGELVKVIFVPGKLVNFVVKN
jgi:leucyl-tRNA synthetase